MVSVRTFGVMYDHTFLNMQITRSDIRPYIKWAFSLVIIYGHFSLPPGLCGYVQINIPKFITPKGNSGTELNTIHARNIHLNRATSLLQTA